VPDFWLDTDCFIRPKNEGYGFDLAPGFWTFLEQKGKEGVIASSARVYEELREGKDELATWADSRNASGFFVVPDDRVQATFQRVADNVMENYEERRALEFLAKADGWLIAHAIVQGGQVVTLEKRQPLSHKPKIPDVCDAFRVKPLDLWEALRKLGLRLT